MDLQSGMVSVTFGTSSGATRQKTYPIAAFEKGTFGRMMKNVGGQILSYEFGGDISDAGKAVATTQIRPFAYTGGTIGDKPPLGDIETFPTGSSSGLRSRPGGSSPDPVSLNPTNPLASPLDPVSARPNAPAVPGGLSASRPFQSSWTPREMNQRAVVDRRSTEYGKFIGDIGTRFGRTASQARQIVGEAYNQGMFSKKSGTRYGDIEGYLYDRLAPGYGGYLSGVANRNAQLQSIYGAQGAGQRRQVQFSEHEFSRLHGFQQHKLSAGVLPENIDEDKFSHRPLYAKAGVFSTGSQLLAPIDTLQHTYLGRTKSGGFVSTFRDDQWFKRTQLFGKHPRIRFKGGAEISEPYETALRTGTQSATGDIRQSARIFLSLSSIGTSGAGYARKGVTADRSIVKELLPGQGYQVPTLAEARQRIGEWTGANQAFRAFGEKGQPGAHVGWNDPWHRRKLVDVQEFDAGGDRALRYVWEGDVATHRMANKSDIGKSVFQSADWVDKMTEVGTGRALGMDFALEMKDAQGAVHARLASMSRDRLLSKLQMVDPNLQQLPGSYQELGDLQMRYYHEVALAGKDPGMRLTQANIPGFKVHDDSIGRFIGQGADSPIYQGGRQITDRSMLEPTSSGVHTVDRRVWGWEMSGSIRGMEEYGQGTPKLNWQMLQDLKADMPSLYGEIMGDERVAMRRMAYQRARESYLATSHGADVDATRLMAGEASDAMSLEAGQALIARADKAALAARGVDSVQKLARGELNRSLIDEMSRNPLFSKPVQYTSRTGQTVTTMGAEAVRTFRGQKNTMGEDVASISQAEAELMRSWAAGGAGMEKAIGKYRSAIDRLNQGEGILKGLTSAPLYEGARGDVLKEAQGLPADKVWAGSDVAAGTPVAIFRQPTTERGMTDIYRQATLAEAEAAGIDPRSNEIRLPMGIIQAAGGDADGDLVAAKVLQGYSVDDQGRIVDKDGSIAGRLTSKQEISKNELLAIGRGAGNLNAELARNLTQDQATRLAREKGKYRTQSEADILKHLESGAYTREATGTASNVGRRMLGTAATPGQRAAAGWMEQAIYSTAQRPAEPPKTVSKFMESTRVNWSSGYSVGVYSGEAERQVGGKGIHWAARGMVEALVTPTGWSPEGTPAEAARAAVPTAELIAEGLSPNYYEGQTAKIASAVALARQDPTSEDSVLRVQQAMFQDAEGKHLGLPKWAEQALFARVAAAQSVGKTMAKGERLGVDPVKFLADVGGFSPAEAKRMIATAETTQGAIDMTSRHPSSLIGQTKALEARGLISEGTTASMEAALAEGRVPDAGGSGRGGGQPPVATATPPIPEQPPGSGSNPMLRRTQEFVRATTPPSAGAQQAAASMGGGPVGLAPPPPPNFPDSPHAAGSGYKEPDTERASVAAAQAASAAAYEAQTPEERAEVRVSRRARLGVEYDRARDAVAARAQTAASRRRAAGASWAAEGSTGGGGLQHSGGSGKYSGGRTLGEMPQSVQEEAVRTAEALKEYQKEVNAGKEAFGETRKEVGETKRALNSLNKSVGKLTQSYNTPAADTPAGEAVSQMRMMQPWLGERAAAAGITEDRMRFEESMGVGAGAGGGAGPPGSGDTALTQLFGRQPGPGGGRQATLGSVLGKGIRGVFGGWGMFYMQRMLGIGTRMAKKGIGQFMGEQQAIQQASFQAGYGPGIGGVAEEMMVAGAQGAQMWSNIGRASWNTWGGLIKGAGVLQAGSGGLPGWAASVGAPSVAAGALTGWLAGVFGGTGTAAAAGGAASTTGAIGAAAAPLALAVGGMVAIAGTAMWMEGQHGDAEGRALDAIISGTPFETSITQEGYEQMKDSVRGRAGGGIYDPYGYAEDDLATQRLYDLAAPVVEGGLAGIANLPADARRLALQGYAATKMPEYLTPEQKYQLQGMVLPYLGGGAVPGGLFESLGQQLIGGGQPAAFAAAFAANQPGGTLLGPRGMLQGMMSAASIPPWQHPFAIQRMEALAGTKGTWERLGYDPLELTTTDRVSGVTGAPLDTTGHLMVGDVDLLQMSGDRFDMYVSARSQARQAEMMGIAPDKSITDLIMSGAPIEQVMQEVNTRSMWFNSAQGVQAQAAGWGIDPTIATSMIDQGDFGTLRATSKILGQDPWAFSALFDADPLSMPGQAAGALEAYGLQPQVDTATGMSAYQQRQWDIRNRKIGLQYRHQRFGMQMGQRQAAMGFKHSMTMMGYQNQMSDIGYSYGMARAALGLERLDLRAQQFKESQDMQAAGAGMEFAHFMQRWELAGKGLEMQQRQFTENWQVQGQRQATQHQWQMDDWSYQRNLSQLQYGWQMEDFQQGIRRSTGRQRQDLIRQRGRATTLHTMEQGQAEEVKSRMEQQREWQIEDHERQKRFYDENMRLQLEQHDLSKKQAEERMGLQAAQAELAKKHFEEQDELDRRAHQLTMGELAAKRAVEMQMRQENENHLKNQYKLQIEANKEAEQYAKDMHQVLKDEILLSDEITRQQGLWRKFFEEEFPRWFRDFKGAWKDAAETRPTQQNSGGGGGDDGGGDDGGGVEDDPYSEITDPTQLPPPGDDPASEYHSGVSYVPRTADYTLEQGEAVLTRDQATALLGSAAQTTDDPREVMVVLLRAILNVLERNNGLTVNVFADDVIDGVRAALPLSDRIHGG